MFRRMYLNVSLLLLLISACQPAEEKAAAAASEAMAVKTLNKMTKVERGAYLVAIMDCNACHTPKKMTEKGPVPDMTRLLSGYPGDQPLPELPEESLPWVLFHPDLTAAVGPWGITFAANLTPHESGLGTWTEEQFVKALREGKHKGLENGRPILPPMPWENYKALKDDDLRAIFAYLKSIPPIDNVVPAVVSPKALPQ